MNFVKCKLLIFIALVVCFGRVDADEFQQKALSFLKQTSQLYKNKQYTEAIATAKHALAMAEKSDQPQQKTIAAAIAKIAINCRLAKDIECALEFYQKSIEQYQALGWEKKETRRWHILADLYQQKQQLPEQLNALNKALALEVAKALPAAALTHLKIGWNHDA